MSRHTQVCIIGDRHVIKTDARRSEAVLLVLSGSTLKEVGARLGVTKERVRQFMQDVGLNAHMRKRWHSTERMESFLRGRVAERERAERRWMRGQEVVAVLKMFAAIHGRAPTSRELYWIIFDRPPAIGEPTPTLCSYLGAHMAGDYWRRLQAAYRLAGLARRKKGSPGHVGPRIPAVACRRGHPHTDENTRWITNARGYRVRRCLDCARFRAKRRKLAATIFSPNSTV